MDFWGLGQSIIFVEVNSLQQQCLCETAKAMADYAHSRIIKIGDDDPAQIALLNYLQGNVMAADQVCIVAIARTCGSCKAALANMRGCSTLVLYDATAGLLAGAAPNRIALDVIDFIANNANSTTTKAD